MNKKSLALYGLKWNPFAPDAPARSFLVSTRLERLRQRVENLAGEGGFALVTGDPGTGKSVALRIIVDHLQSLRDVEVRVLTRPHGSVADFYRELGDLYAVELRPHNRWAGARTLRQRWQSHIDAALFHPVLVVDEAQEMQVRVLNELRLLASSDLDARSLLAIVLAGDDRLLDKLRCKDLLPLASRMRVRLALEALKPDELEEHLDHVMGEAGNARLMTPELVRVLAEHAAGNLRALMSLAAELLEAGVQKEGAPIDERLYFEILEAAAPPPPVARKRGRKTG